jgi:hypothetical protein
MERGFENDADGFLWLIRMLGHARLIERGMLPANLAQSLSIEKTWLALHHSTSTSATSARRAGEADKARPVPVDHLLSPNGQHFIEQQTAQYRSESRKSDKRFFGWRTPSGRQHPERHAESRVWAPWHTECSN